MMRWTVKWLPIQNFLARFVRVGFGGVVVGSISLWWLVWWFGCDLGTIGVVFDVLMWLFGARP